jgi:hypothetical protein
MGTASAWSIADRVSSRGTAGWSSRAPFAVVPRLRPNWRRGLADPIGEKEAPNREAEAAEPGDGEQRVPTTRRHHQRPRDRDGRSQRGHRSGPQHRATRRLRGEREQEHAEGEDVQAAMEPDMVGEPVLTARPSALWKRSISRT